MRLCPVRVHRRLGFNIALELEGKKAASWTGQTQMGRVDVSPGLEKTKKHPGEEFQENRIKHSPV